MMSEDQVHAWLERFFSQEGRGPGCYNDPEFIAVERDHPNILEAYGHHVLTVGPRENDGKESLVAAAATKIGDILSALPPVRSRGLCRNASTALINVLQAFDIWSFAINGSASVYAPPESDKEGHHFWIQDRGSTPGHTWVVAPPFMIVDATARFQGWQKHVKDAIPALVMIREPEIEPPLFNRWVAPHLRSQPQYRQGFAHLQRYFWSWLPCCRVELASAHIHYLPGGITVPAAGEWADFAGVKLDDIIQEIRR